MRILFVTPEPPYPPHSGGRILTFHAIRWLKDRHEVSVLSLVHPGQSADPGPLREWCTTVDFFPARGRWHLPSILQAGLDPRRPYKAIRFGQADWRRRFAELRGQGAFDVVHLQTFYPGEVLGADPGVPVLHYKENVEGLLLRQLAARARNPVLRALAAVEARRTLRYELTLAARCTRTLAISEADRERMLAAGYQGAELGVLPPCIDTDAHPPQPPRPDDPAFDVVFTGRMKYYPNADGALWLVREVMPHVWRQRPGTTVALVGHDPPPAMRRLGADVRVTVTGHVPETAPYLRAAKVFTVPLRLGGGVRLKLLESGAAGKAIVSTPLGAEGLALEDGRDLLLADTPDTFARSILMLLADLDRGAALGRQARATVVSRYDYRAVIPQLEAHYQALAGG